MEYKTKRLDNASVQIILKNTAQEVIDAYAKAYEKASAKVRIPGFRKGKVPLEVLERELGDAVAGDAAQILVAESMEKLLSEIKPPPISVPSFEVEQFDRKQGATYKGTFDTYPEVKLGKYKKVKATQDVADITEEDVTSESERLRKENSIMQSKDDSAVMADFVTMDIEIRHVDSKKKLYSNKEYKIQLTEPSPFPGLVEQLIGMKAGESKTYEQQMEESFPDEKFAGKNVAVAVKLEVVQAAILPELNDDFVKEVSHFENVGQLKDHIRNTLNKNAEGVLKERAMKILLDQIAADTKSEMPMSLVELEVKERVRQIARKINRKDMSLEELAKLMGKPEEELKKELEETAKTSVKKRLILEEIAKKESIKVEEADILAAAEERFGSLGDELKQQLLSNEKFVEELEGMVLFRKTFDWIHENADIKTGAKISLSALNSENID
ncbi:MAG: trigger factor [Spirochaetia bacterium]|nr:trigger factor [Spirochaetia bacterium]